MADLGLARGPLDVGVLDAQDERAAGAASHQVVEQRRARVADVQVAGRAGGEADTHIGDQWPVAVIVVSLSRRHAAAARPRERRSPRRARSRPRLRWSSPSRSPPTPAMPEGARQRRRRIASRCGPSLGRSATIVASTFTTRKPAPADERHRVLEHARCSTRRASARRCPESAGRCRRATRRRAARRSPRGRARRRRSARRARGRTGSRRRRAPAGARRRTDAGRNPSRCETASRLGDSGRATAPASIRRATSASAMTRSSTVVTLMFRTLPSTSRTAYARRARPAPPRRSPSTPLCPSATAVAQHVAAERLRRLREKDALARQRALHDAPGAGSGTSVRHAHASRRPFDRVAGRRGRRSPRRIRPRHRSAASIVAASTSGRAASWISTMSASAGTAANPFATESWRRSPPATSRTPLALQAGRRRVDPLGRHHDDDVADAVAGQQRVEAPLQHRPAAEVEQLLGHTRAQASSASSGCDDGGYVHGRLPTMGRNLSLYRLRPQAQPAAGPRSAGRSAPQGSG